VQPATKFNDLIERAQALVKTNAQPDDMEIRRIERDALSMRRSGTDIAGSWEVAAMCAALRGDADAVMAAWTSGQLAPGRDEFTPLRFGLAFADVCQEQKARELAHAAVQANPKNPTVLTAAEQILGRCGFIHEASYLRQAAAELRGESIIEEISAEALHAWLPDELTAPIMFARHFLARKGFKSRQATSWLGTGDDEQTPAFVYLAHVELDVEQTVAFEAELSAGLFIQNFPAERDGRVIVGFRSVTRNSEDADNIK
jgi:hypothetical protein